MPTPAEITAAMNRLVANEVKFDALINQTSGTVTVGSPPVAVPPLPVAILQIAALDTRTDILETRSTILASYWDSVGSEIELRTGDGFPPTQAQTQIVIFVSDEAAPANPTIFLNSFDPYPLLETDGSPIVEAGRWAAAEPVMIFWHAGLEVWYLIQPRPVTSSGGGMFVPCTYWEMIGNQIDVRGSISTSYISQRTLEFIAGDACPDDPYLFADGQAPRQILEANGDLITAGRWPAFSTVRVKYHIGLNVWHLLQPDRPSAVDEASAEMSAQLDAVSFGVASLMARVAALESA
jgi:hypothetical protein